MSESKTKNKPNAVWNFFSSVKLTMVLLIILAIVSILGTLIPQREYAVQFSRNLSPEMLRVFNYLDLFDMYHSIWFRLLMGCLTLNLIICSIDRFSGTWKLFRASPRPDRTRPFEHIPQEQSFIVQEKVKESAQRVGRFLQIRYRKIDQKDSEDKHFFFGEKGRYAYFGVYLVHLSVLIILVGSLVGSFFGFEAYVNIMEGEQIDTVNLRKGMDRLELNFEVRCNKFFVDFYENGAPKEYRSDLSFLINGKVVEERSVLVNHPVKFRGVTFYQSNYGTIPGERVRLKISRHASDHGITEIVAETGNSLQLPGNEGEFKVADVKQDFMRMGPAVLITVRPNLGEETRFWIFQNEKMIRKKFPGLMDKFPKLNPSAFKPYTFSVDGMESRYYTGLQVNKDPGVPIVWTGFFLIVAGFFLTFFMSHRRIWVRISREKQGIKVSIAGTSGKDPVGLQRELENLTNDLKNMFLEKG